MTWMMARKMHMCDSRVIRATRESRVTHVSPDSWRRGNPPSQGGRCSGEHVEDISEDLLCGQLSRATSW